MQNQPDYEFPRQNKEPKNTENQRPLAPKPVYFAILKDTFFLDGNVS